MHGDSQKIRNTWLALRCRRGDEAAFSELVRAWEQRLFYFVRRLVPREEDAWDVLQEVWVKVFRAIASLRQPERLAVWLYSIAHKTAMSHLRAAYVRREEVENEPVPESVADDSANWPTEDAHRVHEALDRIAPPFREVLTLHFLQDFSVEEIAGIIGVPAGTVKSRLFHARKALRKALERSE
jgi:RNA polymerase sigma-70 factor (ECF subfamily)